MNILRLIAQGEHEKQDFKFEISDARKIAISLVAFSNTLGGRLLVGVKDNGRIAGVRSNEEIHMLEQAAQMYCRPQVEIEFEVAHHEGKSVLVCHVPSDPAHPRQAEQSKGEWRYFTRIADENIAINKVIVEACKPLQSNASEEWTEQELSWIKTLAKQGPFSRSSFQRLTRLKPNKADRFLSNLIRWNLAKWESTNGQIRYFIDEEDE